MVKWTIDEHVYILQDDNKMIVGVFQTSRDAVKGWEKEEGDNTDDWVVTQTRVQ